MSLMHYIQTNFTRDLKSMKYIEHGGRRFFGGREWANFKDDTNQISNESLAYFSFSLFTMICADQNMYTNFRFAYAKWEKRTKSIYPKFGWPGFSEHHEKPEFLLTIPEKNGVDFDKITQDDIEEFVKFNLSVSLVEFGIDTKVFFLTMVEDVDFNFENKIFKDLKKYIIFNT